MLIKFLRSGLLVCIVLVFSLILSHSSTGLFVAYGVASTKKGAFIDSARFIQYLDENTALQEMKSGRLDTYYFRVPLEVVSDLKRDPALMEYRQNGWIVRTFVKSCSTKK